MSNFLWHNIFKKTESEFDVIARLWQNTPLFKGIPARHIKVLAENMHIRDFQPDEVVFHQGDAGAGAILVLKGEVRIMASHIEITRLNEGDFFGEITLAEVDKRTADAYSICKSRLVYFLKADLQEWIEIEPLLGNKFLMNLASTLAQRLHQANRLLAEKSSSR